MTEGNSFKYQAAAARACRSHPAEAADYERLKQPLAGQFERDRDPAFKTNTTRPSSGSRRNGRQRVESFGSESGSHALPDVSSRRCTDKTGVPELAGGELVTAGQSVDVEVGFAAHRDLGACLGGSHEHGARTRR